MVEGGGFEPPKSYDDRFTVCSLWPLGNPSDLAGAGDGTRTRNPLITNQVLCQLSYASNRRRHLHALFALGKQKSAFMGKYFAARSLSCTCFNLEYRIVTLKKARGNFFYRTCFPCAGRRLSAPPACACFGFAEGQHAVHVPLPQGLPLTAPGVISPWGPYWAAL